MTCGGVDLAGVNINTLESRQYPGLFFAASGGPAADTGAASGGSLPRDGLLPAGVAVTPCVPSLFTLKIPDEGLRALMGTVVEQAGLSLAGTKFRAAGTLLLTDWGVSGPATLRLSSYAARHLAENGYAGTLLVNWLDAPEAEARGWIAATGAENPRKQAAGTPPAGITARLWRHILRRAGLRDDLRWAELGAKGAARLAATLSADAYAVAGRARFKEEFVTCGLQGRVRDLRRGGPRRREHQYFGIQTVPRPVLRRGGARRGRRDGRLQPAGRLVHRGRGGRQPQAHVRRPRTWKVSVAPASVTASVLRAPRSSGQFSASCPAGKPQQTGMS